MPEQTEEQVMAELIRDEPECAKKIPAITLHHIQRYVAHGDPGGHFIKCLMSNDLKGVFNYADADNWPALGHIMQYLMSVRADCWGSPEKYANWLAFRRLSRERREAELNPEEGA